MSDSIFHPLSHPPSASPRRRPSRAGGGAKGFTLVELLTVISIIVVLIGLLFVAIKYARNSAARSQTLAQMDTLRGMLGELDSANHFSLSPQAWLWYDATGSYMTTAAGQTGPYNLVVRPGYIFTFSAGSPSLFAGQTLNADFWKYPFAIPSNTAATSWDSLDSPGDVNANESPQQDSQRNASFAVLNTQLAMQMLAAVPANRSAFDKLSANAKMLPVWNAGPVLQAPQSGSNLTGVLREDGTDGQVTNLSNYAQGMHVVVKRGQFGAQNPTADCYFVCLVSPSTSSAPPVQGSTTATWQDESGAPRGAPVLLDGWGNPIIFVPATGLRVKKLNGQGIYNAADPTQDFIIISPEGLVDPKTQGTANPVVLRPGRPFFASAGPDGDFTKGDDNLYSFEN